MDLIDFGEINFSNRIREDLGDIDGLAVSIRDNGLMQPIVLDDQNNLIAGGRRLTAHSMLANGKVPCDDPEKYTKVPYVRLGTLAPSKRRLLELEENIQRKDMNWQEKVIGLADYHRLSVREGLKDGLAWTQSMTGRLVGLDQSSVSLALKVAKELKEPGSKFWKCESLRDAISMFAVAKLDEAAKLQLQRIRARQEEQAKNVELRAAQITVTPALEQQVALMSKQSLAQVFEMEQPTPTSTSANVPVVAQATVSVDDIARFYLQGNCLELLPQVAKKQVINHIVTDPPFGIDMANLDEDNIARVKDEHGVESNLDLLENFLKVSYDCIALDGFMAMWYDLDHHEKIKNWAEKIGWKVCRWPLVWCKTSPCANNSAQYNITKSTEVCYFLRRSEKSIIKCKQSNNFVLSNRINSGTHPFVKPSRVWSYILETISLEGQTVVDPFAGEGSSLCPIFKAGRIPLGIELKPEHIASGLSFIQQALAFTPKLSNDLLSKLPL